LQKVIAEAKGHSLKTALLLVILALLVLGLVGVAIGGITYVASRETTKTTLPGISVEAGVGAAPLYVTAIRNVSRPLGVAVNTTGDRIYVTESSGERETKVFDLKGNLIRSLVPPDTTSSSRNPIYVAVGPDGRVYTSDRLRRTIDIYSSDGAYEGTLASPGGEEWSPLGLSFDGQGNLLVTDLTKGQHRVLVINPQGEKVLEFGKEGREPGELSFPNAAISLGQGRYAVSDSNNGRVAVYGGEGQFLYAFGTGMALPRGLAYDADRGRLYVVDTTNHRVTAYKAEESSFARLFAAGQEGVGQGEFEFPNGLALDRSGRLYITDRENNRVQVWGY